jgi:hypothetical protein
VLSSIFFYCVITAFHKWLAEGGYYDI